MLIGSKKASSLNLNLKNRNFLITGSSRGIGKSIAEGFLAEEANVGLVARTSTTLKETAQLLDSKYKSKVNSIGLPT